MRHKNVSGEFYSSNGGGGFYHTRYTIIDWWGVGGGCEYIINLFISNCFIFIIF